MGNFVTPQYPIINRGGSLARGLVFDLPFAEGGGLFTREATGLVQIPFTYDSFAADDWNISKYGHAMKFGTAEGFGRRITFDPNALSNNVLDVTDGITMEGIWRNNVGNQFGFLFAYTLAGGNPRKFYITCNNSNLEIRIQKGDNSGNIDATMVGVVTTGEWFYTIVTYDGKIQNHYNNAELKTTTVATDEIITKVSLAQYNMGAEQSDGTGGD